MSASPLAGPDRLVHIIGNRDESLKALERAFNVKIRIVSEGFVVEGPPDAAEKAPAVPGRVNGVRGRRVFGSIH